MISQKPNEFFIKQTLANLKKLYVSSPRVAKLFPIQASEKMFFTEFGQFLELAIIVNVYVQVYSNLYTDLKKETINSL